MARKKNTENPVTEEVKTQDPTVTSETPVISNEESAKQEQDTVETSDTSSIKESSQKPEKIGFSGLSFAAVGKRR